MSQSLDQLKTAIAAVAETVAYILDYGATIKPEDRKRISEDMRRIVAALEPEERT